MKTLLKNLIHSAPTEDRGEQKAAQVLYDYFTALNIPVKVETWDTNRSNAVIHIQSKGKRPALLFGAHLDVVPAQADQWTVDPHRAIEKDGRIYGRGATDMLGGLASAACAIAQTIQNGTELEGDLILAATAGEETDSCGVIRFVESVRDTLGLLAGVILPEPTALEILTAHRGILWIRITLHGKSAHGSMPRLGINAIEKANTLLSDLFQFQVDDPPHPLLGSTSVSINRITGGTATNIVPDKCEIEMDTRTLPDTNFDKTIHAIQALLDDHTQKDADFSAELSVLRRVPAIETDADCDFVKTVCGATGISKTGVVAFTTDGPHFHELSPNIIILGPGRPQMCHKPDEYIETSQLETAVKMYQQIIERLLT